VPGCQTCNGSEKGNTFYQGRSQDHVCTNVVGSLRLACNCLNCTFTYLANADTCANCGKTGANSATHVGETNFC